MLTEITPMWLLLLVKGNYETLIGYQTALDLRDCKDYAISEHHE